jgi:hypothetical protein
LAWEEGTGVPSLFLDAVVADAPSCLTVEGGCARDLRGDVLTNVEALGLGGLKKAGSTGWGWTLRTHIPCQASTHSVSEL